MKLLAVFLVVCGLGLPAREALGAPPPLTGRAYTFAERAYQALEAGRLERAMEFALQALELAPGHAGLLLLQADILERQDKPREAVVRISHLTPADLGGVGLAQRGYLWLKLGNAAAAEADFAAAIDAGGLDAAARANIASELAYLALARKDDASALKWFRMALERKSAAGLYADAGYAASRLAQNGDAVEMFTKAVDEWHAAPADKKPFDDTALYGMRRSIDTLSRRWGASFSIGHGMQASGLATSGDVRVVQAGAEVFYTPERFGYRDERIFQVYANAFRGLSASEDSFVTGKDSQVASLGARYKPLRKYDLVLALERRFAIGEQAGEDDWLARIGFSASRETDWSPTKDSWTTWQLYTETAYFLDANRLIQPFEARVGRSWKAPRWYGAVVTPYVAIGGEYDDALDPKLAAGIGPGLAVRYWFGETRYRAFSNYVDFSVQYRFRLTDAKRGGGVFATLMVSF
jgi:tetratricopeptide (TPR) repeat protein